MGRKLNFKVLIKKYLIVLVGLCVSCGQSDEEKIKGVLETSEILLSTSQCQPAIDLLEAVGRQNLNARYLKNLASAYACRAGYSSIKFFGSDIALSVTPAPMGGVARYSTSQATSTSPLTSDTKFRDLQTAIDILLYAGGLSSTTVEPTSTNRNAKFTSSEAGDINAQLLYMMLVQLGKIMRVYSDANALGAKGGGALANNCFTTYSNVTAFDIALAMAAMPGACTVTNNGHTELAVGVATRRKRLCEGVVLLNGIFDLIPVVLSSIASGSISNISTIDDQISLRKTELTTKFPAIGTTLTVMNQYICENDTNITIETLESYFALIFEYIIQ